MKFIEKLDLLMKSREINRSEFSKQAEIPYMTVVNFYEKGTDNVKLSTLKKISAFFGCSLDYLADDEVNECNTNIKNLQNCHINCTPKEKELIEAYRSKPEMQGAVDKILEINKKYIEEYSNEYAVKRALL